MRRVLLSGAVAALSWAAASPPAAAAVAYGATIERPAAGQEGYARVEGTAPVRVRLSGGVADARYAAFHVRRTGTAWRQDRAVAMERVSEGVFAGLLDSASLANAAYELEVRVWGDAPAYSPSDPGTYAADVVEARVDNPPPEPRGAAAAVATGAARVTWRHVATHARPDFLGYRVWTRPGGRCSDDPARYELAAETAETSWVRGNARGETFCVRIAAVRSSVISETISSPLSPPLRVHIAASGPGTGAYSVGRGTPEAPPEAPRLFEGEVHVSDGRFGDRLPFGPKSVRRPVTRTHTVRRTVPVEGSRELGPDLRQGPLAVATGLVLLVSALHLRRFLRPGTTS